MIHSAQKLCEQISNIYIFQKKTRIGVDVEVEPLVELFGRREDVGQQKVEQRPELVQVVLQRGPRQQQSKLEVHFATHLCQLSFHVFDDVAFVQNKTTPVDLVHERVLHRWVLEHLVGRHDLPGWW